MVAAYRPWEGSKEGRLVGAKLFDPGADRGADPLVHRDRLHADRRLEVDRRHEPVEPVAVGRTRVHAERDP